MRRIYYKHMRSVGFGERFDFWDEFVDGATSEAVVDGVTEISIGGNWEDSKREKEDIEPVKHDMKEEGESIIASVQEERTYEGLKPEPQKSVSGEHPPTHGDQATKPLTPNLNAEDGSEWYQTGHTKPVKLEEDYVYSPLDDQKGETRFIVLRGRVHTRGLHISLVRCNPQLMIQYRAISYAWGDSVGQHRIRCSDGHFIKIGDHGVEIREELSNTGITVSDTLYALLTELQPENADIVLWIDAICINQRDLIERASQVQMMDQIYAWAICVIIWLPPDNSREVEMALQAIRSLCSIGMRFSGDGSQKRNGGETISLRFEYPSEPDDEQIAERRQLSSFCSMLSKPWFTRVWTVQEVIMGPDSIVRFGHKEFSWIALVGACAVAADFHYTWPLAASKAMSVLQIEKICVALEVFYAQPEQPARLEDARLLGRQYFDICDRAGL